VFRKPQFRVTAWMSDILIESFRCFSQSLQTNIGVVLLIGHAHFLRHASSLSLSLTLYRFKMRNNNIGSGGIHLPVLTSLPPFFFSWDEVRLSPLGTPVTTGPFVPAPDEEYGAVGGMNIVRGNRSTCT
jgi:hypothetical protein